MTIHRAHGHPAEPAPEPTFTGDVRISDYVRRESPSRLLGARAHFAPGARTPWKTNPCGQTLVITSGTGWVQTRGAAIAEVRAGDVVWCPPGEEHWDGATPSEAMSYVALHEVGVVFGDAVTDEEYLVGPPSPHQSEGAADSDLVR